MKRLFGIILFLFGLIGLSPLLLALARRIKKEDRGASVLPRGRENLLRFCFAKEDDVLDEASR